MKFLVWMIGAMGMLSLGWMMLIALQSGRPTISSQWITDAYAMKTATADTIKKPKIVIVAGSNALFGIDSKMIEEEYGYPVLNYGVNAGLLLPYVLLKSQSVLKKGDIVIMPLEYHFYTYDGVPNAQMIDQIWSRNPEFFWKLSWSEQARMIWMTPFSRLMEGFLAQGGDKTMCGPYGYQNLDGRGDQIHTSVAEAKQWEYDWDTLKKELPRRYGVEGGENEEGWRWLGEFASWAEQNGIRLIVTPPTMMRQESYLSDPIERHFYEGLRAKVEALGIVYIGNPYESMYEREMYFNTDYHLNDQGREQWTQYLIDIVRSEISSDYQYK